MVLNSKMFHEGKRTACFWIFSFQVQSRYGYYCDEGIILLESDDSPFLCKMDSLSTPPNGQNTK